MAMTREDKLYSMRMQELVGVAEKLGIKINTKAAKSQAVEKILAAEKAAAEEKTTLVEDLTEAGLIAPTTTTEESEATVEPLIDLDNPVTEEEAKEYKMLSGDEALEIAVVDPDEPIVPAKPKRGALIEYNGKAQNICAWAKELGVSANTLYGRIYKLGWPVDKAFAK